MILDFATYTRSTAHCSPPDIPATLDAVYSRDGVLVAVVEAKTRVSYDLPKIEGYGSYLVTEDKLTTLLHTSKALGIPSFLLTELSDGARLFWPIGDAAGLPAISWNVASTRTQATSIGPETVVRRNAYLPMAEARRWGYGRILTATVK